MPHNEGRFSFLSPTAAQVLSRVRMSNAGPEFAGGGGGGLRLLGGFGEKLGVLGAYRC